MSLNLIVDNRSVDGEAIDRANWDAIKAVSNEGHVFIDEHVVELVASLLEDKRLSNGEKISAYPCIDEPYPAYVSAFGPAMLSADVLAGMRTLLETQPGAAELLDLVVERGLQIGLKGKETVGAYIKAVNWDGDEVALKRSSGTMKGILRDLGLGEYVRPGEETGEMPFGRFKQAVEDLGDYAASAPGEQGLDRRLRALVECGVRRGATHIYWA